MVEPGGTPARGWQGQGVDRTGITAPWAAVIAGHRAASAPCRALCPCTQGKVCRAVPAVPDPSAEVRQGCCDLWPLAPAQGPGTPAAQRGVQHVAAAGRLLAACCSAELYALTCPLHWSRVCCGTPGTAALSWLDRGGQEDGLGAAVALAGLDALPACWQLALSSPGTAPLGKLLAGGQGAWGAAGTGESCQGGSDGAPCPLCPQVQWLEQQVAKRRTKRDVFMEPTDPKFPQQWYLVSAGQGPHSAKQGREPHSCDSECKFWVCGCVIRGMAVRWLLLLPAGLAGRRRRRRKA